MSKTNDKFQRFGPDFGKLLALNHNKDMNITKKENHEDTHELISFSEAEVRIAFSPLGAEEYEIQEIEESLNSALYDLDHEYLEECVKDNLNITETLMERITELSDTTKPVHVPYELIVESLRDAPEKIKILCNPELTDSPREILKRILNSSYEDYGYPFDLAE